MRTTTAGGRAGVLLRLLLTAGLVPACAIQKTVQVGEPRANDPVLITRVTLDGADISCGAWTMRKGGPPEVGLVLPFEAGDDWLWHIAIHVLNRTDKPIARLMLHLHFPEISKGTLATLGRLPDSVIAARSIKAGKPWPRSGQAISFQHGQVLVVHADDYLTRGSPVDTMFYLTTNFIVRVGEVYFADGMRWFGGVYSVPDPARLGEYKDMDARYFPNAPGNVDELLTGKGK